MNIESSHKFNRSGDTAYGCIEGINLEQYQIGIEKGVQINESTQKGMLLYLLSGADRGGGGGGQWAGRVICFSDCEV